MTVIYPSFLEIVIFSLLGFVCGYITRILFAVIVEGFRAAVIAIRRRQIKREVNTEGTTWDEAIAAFKRPDDSPS